MKGGTADEEITGKDGGFLGFLVEEGWGRRKETERFENMHLHLCPHDTSGALVSWPPAPDPKKFQARGLCKSTGVSPAGPDRSGSKHTQISLE